MTSGSIHRPDGASTDQIFYVPQKPYTTIGTLREQVHSPISCSETRAARPPVTAQTLAGKAAHTC